MEIIDLTHTIEENMPSYPGEESAHIKKKNTHQSDGFQVIRMTMLTHTGTHLDTPAHFYADGLTTDVMPLTSFYGKGVLIDCTGCAENEIIDEDFIKLYRLELEKADFALIFTGWSKFWGKDKYFEAFPVLSNDAAKYLLTFNLKGIGLDAISIDPVESRDFPNHQLVLSKGLIIIENLTNLEALIGKQFNFASFPLKIKEGDGSPVRAAAILQ